ncbi:MAG TPA: adenylyl-sulfate kinase [Acidimicrobiales bacterium]|nr:adenylyl-sulfate kinase [Acidimicrobiales bacterium]
MTVPVLLLTGTVGAGKTTIAEAINGELYRRDIAHAALDLDALIWHWPQTSRWHQDLLFENLAAVWSNFAAHGATRLVLARVLEDVGDLDRYRVAVPGAEITVCRVIAPHDMRVERLKRRMQPGEDLDWHLHRTGELHDILERAAYEDFVVENVHRPVRDVALEVLTKAGWL